VLHHVFLLQMLELLLLAQHQEFLLQLHVQMLQQHQELLVLLLLDLYENQVKPFRCYRFHLPYRKFLLTQGQHLLQPL